jgi:aryl-alcohol dehydrogenase-like predicted oxidoreductase/predicted dehydrogenase
VSSVKTRWGILATGSIATQFATDLPHSHTGVLTGVASREASKAKAFCETHGGTPSDYETLLARDDIDAVYIATPHDSHLAWSHKAMAAGKAVLCEKPLGLNQGQVLNLYGEAARTDVLLVEALMYLMHPRMHLAKSLLEQGAIGKLTGFSASFGFAFPFTPTHRLYDIDRAGGGILDIGIYPLTAARYFLGEPMGLTGEARLAPSGADAEAKATLAYDGFEAHLHCAIDTTLDWHITLEGDAGVLKITQPWHPGPENNHISITDIAGKETLHRSDDQRPLYAIEADHMGALLARGAKTSDLVTPDFSINTAYWMDRWREAGGVTYAADALAEVGFQGQAVRLGAHGHLETARLGGLEKPVSKLVLGTDNQIDASTMAAMADAFVEAGGNCFDTAFIYSDGRSEALLGEWMKARGLRDELVVLSKGAHTPDCTPEAVSHQLDISLERLQTDYLDLYCLHRDDPQVPVSEWIDVLNREVAAGRIGQFGGSNWTAERVDEANAYADAKGLQGFSLLSNNFSLARMETPVWPGCLASSTDAFRNWHTKTNLALLPWSAQARGFFLDWEGAGLAATRHGADPSDEEMNRVWGSADNLERRRRAFDLAEKLGVSALQIALAYVLRQPFPCFAIIGPRTPMQLQDSLRAADIQLTAAQINWLDLRD